jgi:hypothetical protein
LPPHSRLGSQAIARGKPACRTGTRVDAPKQAATVRLVEKVVEAKRKNAEADTTALERKIDEQVHALYGLTPEDIKLVEEAGATR